MHHEHIIFLFFCCCCSCSCFNNSQTKGVRWQSHCGVDLHFPEDLWYWTPFHTPVGHLYLFKYFVHFIIRSSAFVLLSCRNSLYILEINLLSEKWFASIFSQSVGCLFTVFFLCCTENFLLFWRSPTCLSLLLLFALFMSYLRHYCLGFTDSVESILIPIFTEIFENSNIRMELQKTPSSQSHLEKEKRGWRHHTSWFWNILNIKL